MDGRFRHLTIERIEIMSDFNLLFARLTCGAVCFCLDVFFVLVCLCLCAARKIDFETLSRMHVARGRLFT